MDVINANLKFRSKLTPLNFNDVEYVFIHHTMSITATPQQVHQWHLDNLWAGAGYNEYIRKDGTVFIMRGNNQGVHVANYNSIGYGICCEGNYDVEKTMSEAQFKSLVERVKYTVGRFPKKLKVLGHGAVNKTDCPGKFFPMIRLYQELEKKDPELIIQKPTERLISALKILKTYKEINSHDYWLENAVIGGKVNGEYAEIILCRLAEVVDKFVKLDEEEKILTREQLRKILK